VKQNTPDLNLLRKSLFWDTDMSKIDWQLQSIAVIKRVFDRGNAFEKEEIKRFYKSTKIKDALVDGILKPYTINKNNENGLCYLKTLRCSFF